MTETETSQLKELWAAIGNKKEKEFYKKYPDFEVTEEIYLETLHRVMQYIEPEVIGKLGKKGDKNE